MSTSEIGRRVVQEIQNKMLKYLGLVLERFSSPVTRMNRQVGEVMYGK